MKNYLLIIFAILLLLVILSAPLFTREEKMCIDYGNGKAGTCDSTVTVRSSLFDLLRYGRNEAPTMAPTMEPISAESLKDEINNDLVAANYCEVDSDCIVSEGYGCPFGCYDLVNKDADLSGVESKVDQYRRMGGSQCVYDCDRNPNPDEIACVNNKCVDLRYPN